MAKLHYNERSWAIDVISAINAYCSRNNSPIHRAGGEYTVKSVKMSLFPDVLLYGAEETGSVIQGWELKMPDTPITDNILIANAKIKANLLKLNSFLLWNAREAVLYVKKDKEFQALKSWVEPEIEKRSDVEPNPEKWRALLIEILDDLSQFFSTNEHKASELVEISENLYIEALSSFKNKLSKSFEEEAKRNSEFEIKIMDWLPEKNLREERLWKNRYEALAICTILSFLNKLIFSHCLISFTNKAEAISSIGPNSSIDELISVFNEISRKCDHMSVFAPFFGDAYVNEGFVRYLLEVNELLKGFRFDRIDQSYLRKVIDSALRYSKRKTAGQFSTPYALARYLAEITVKDRTANAFDPCCGSGTIARAIYDLKREWNISPEDALSTVWASDKFSFPLQLCSLSLSDPMTQESLVQVFQKDVFVLAPGIELSFIDPFSEERVIKQLPKMHAIVSNLPFVRNESIGSMNKRARQNATDNGQSDLYARIILRTTDLIEDGGRIGVVVSNSWLTTRWGEKFKSQLSASFNILRIVKSANGKWFENADVVATLLVLEKTTQRNNKIDFVSTNKRIDEWTPSTIRRMVASTLSRKTADECISKTTHSTDDIAYLGDQGITWNALFADLSWFKSIASMLKKASDFILFARGERRGWDKLFYPQANHGIEADYIVPVLKSSRNLGDQLIGEAKNDAFCCSLTKDQLKELGHEGALNWISKFEYSTNGKGRPLPQVLAKGNQLWYEMKATSLADMVISMNPDKKLCVFRLKKRSFVNQRLIRLSVKNTQQTDLLHALLNSAISLFYIENIGFGRGLGALDLSSENIARNLRVLDPNLLSQEKRDSIVRSFSNLLKRKAEDLPIELTRDDRIEFDQTVLRAFGIKADLDMIYGSLLTLYRTRKAVEK